MGGGTFILLAVLVYGYYYYSSSTVLMAFFLGNLLFAGGMAVLMYDYYSRKVGFWKEDEAEEWKGLCQTLFPDQTPHYDPLTCSIGCHVGSGAFGMALARRLIP